VPTRHLRIFIFAVAVAASAGVSSLLGARGNQVTSITVFSFIILGVLLYWRFRLIFAFIGFALLLATGVMDIPRFIESAGLDIILFLISMMTIVGFLEERRFFETVLDRVLSLARGSAKMTVAILMAMSALSAALVDEVTSILFMTSTSVHLASRLGISVVPLVMMNVFATIIGSSATVVGNPIGVIIALRAGLGFPDFLRWATPISIAGLALAIPLSLTYFRGYVSKMDSRLKKSVEPGSLNPSSYRGTMIQNRTVPALLFLGTITALILHKQIESYLGLQENSMLLGTAVTGAGIALLLEREKARELVERRVDWWTLSFFLILFSAVGALQLTSVTDLLSTSLVNAGGGDFLRTFLITGWTIGFMSALMDNVVTVSLWIPIVSSMGEAGFNIAPLWWAMLFGGTFMGTLTYIGSSAGIVAVGLIERQRLGHITLRQWMVPGALVSFSTFSLALLLLLLQTPVMTS